MSTSDSVQLKSEEEKEKNSTLTPNTKTTTTTTTTNETNETDKTNETKGSSNINNEDGTKYQNENITKIDTSIISVKEKEETNVNDVKEIENEKARIATTTTTTKTTTSEEKEKSKNDNGGNKKEEDEMDVSVFSETSDYTENDDDDGNDGSDGTILETESDDDDEDDDDDDDDDDNNKKKIITKDTIKKEDDNIVVEGVIVEDATTSGTATTTVSAIEEEKTNTTTSTDDKKIKKRKRRKTRNDINANNTTKKRPRKYKKREKNTNNDITTTATTNATNESSNENNDNNNTTNNNIIKFPPLTSPGLLLNSNGIVTTPSYIFQEALDNSGYTENYRIKNCNTHKTSSYRKVVDDMFDSNIVLSNNINMNDMLMDTNFVLDGDGDDECNEFLNTLSQYSKEIEETKKDNHYYQDDKKRMQFEDMLPISLIANYPQSYKEELRIYTKKVLEREEIIQYNISIKNKSSSSKNKNKSNIKNEINETATSTTINAATTTSITTAETAALDTAMTTTPVEKDVVETHTNNTVTSHKSKPKEVPPMPEVPIIPECYANITTTIPSNTDDGDNKDTSDLNTNNVLSYRYTAHLDPACFVPTMRYYSLLSNNIADPHFVGPNAPGITSSGSNVGQHAYATINPTTGLANSFMSHANKLATATPNFTPSSNPPPNVTIKNLPLFTSKKLPKATTPNAPACTKTISDLRKIMELDKDPIMENKMKECIILSAIDLAKQEEQKTLLNPTLAQHKMSNHAANMVQHPFKGPDDEIYPDVIRAFAAYSDLKPCKRCKSNKQGSFHCRMRRKHDGIDHDGTNSYKILEDIKKKHNLV